MCRQRITAGALNSERLQTKQSWPELGPARPLPPPAAWPLTRPLEDNLQQSHYVPLIISFFLLPILPFAVWQGCHGGVRGREEEGKDAGQTGATAASSEDWPAWSRFEPPTLQLSVKGRPRRRVRMTHQPELMDSGVDAEPQPTISTKKQAIELHLLEVHEHVYWTRVENSKYRKSEEGKIELVYQKPTKMTH